MNDPAYLACGPTLTACSYAQFFWFGTDDVAWNGWSSTPVDGLPNFAWMILYSHGVVKDLSGYNSTNYQSVRLVAGP